MLETGSLLTVVGGGGGGEREGELEGELEGEWESELGRERDRVVEVEVGEVAGGGGGLEVDLGVGEMPESLGVLGVEVRWGGTSEPGTEGVGICPSAGEDEG